MRKSKLTILSSVLLLTLLLFGCIFSNSAIASKKIYNWRLQSILGPGYTEYDVLLKRFVKNINKMSNGRINITIYPANALVPTFETFGAVGKGAFEMHHGCLAYYMGMDPSIEIAWIGSPYFTKLEQYHYMWYEAGMLDLMQEVFAKHNLHLVGPVFSDEWGRVMSTVPIHSLDDYKGLKVRTWGIFGDILDDHGASIVSMPGGEIYTALSTQVVDAANWGSPQLNTTIKLEEVAKYYIGPDFIRSDPEDISINLDLWKELPDDLKLIIEKATRQFAIERNVFSIFESAAAAEKMKAAGVEFMYLPDKDVKYIRNEIMKGLRERSEKNEFSAKAYKIIKETTDHYGDLNEWFRTK